MPLPEFSGIRESLIVNKESSMEISVPTDQDGFILLQCSMCGEYFKLTTHDINDDRNLHIFCPSCGLIPDSYLTEDLIRIAKEMCMNKLNDELYKEFKSLERSARSEGISFQVKKKPKHLKENQIRTGIDVLEIVHFKCCDRDVKINPMLSMTGCTCPFCGVITYDFNK